MSDPRAGESNRTGPLRDLRVLEFAGIGPAPFCGMLLSDLGADVLRIDRAGRTYGPADVETRGRRSLLLDLKTPKGLDTTLALIDKADALIEGFRPGVMERLGLGPDVALQRNPRLVYGRMTGWGQSGPLAEAPGHDINYIALSGALHAIGPAERPAIPLNLVGDFGGGALFLAFGLLAGIHHARASGQGQVIDCAMSEGALALLGMIYGHFATGRWSDERASNIIDGGSHFYNTYRCADGKWLAVGAIEPAFYAALLERAGIEDPEFERQMSPEHWPGLTAKLSHTLASKTREEWCRLLEGTEACITPVLGLAEAPQHPHHRARGAFIEIEGVTQPAVFPRFSKTPGAVQSGPVAAGTHDASALQSWGIDPERVGKDHR